MAMMKEGDFPEVGSLFAEANGFATKEDLQKLLNFYRARAHILQIKLSGKPENIIEDEDGRWLIPIE